MIQTKFVTYRSVLNNFGDIADQTFLSLDNLLNATQLTSVSPFSHYKLNSVKFEYIPLASAIGLTALSATATTEASFPPSFVSLWVNNRDESYSTFDDITNNPRHKFHSPYVNVTRYTKLRMQIDVLMGGLTDVSILRNNTFISTNDTGAVFGRFITRPEPMSIFPDNETSQAYRVKTTTYVSLRNLNNN